MTLLVVATVCAAMVALVGTTWWAAAAVLRREAEVIADTAAIAGAQASARGGVDGCSVASDVVRRHGARLDLCAVEPDMSVQVAVSWTAQPDSPGWPRLQVSARARAGRA